MKYLLSLMLVATMTCEIVYDPPEFGTPTIIRCENKEVICYAYDRNRGAGFSCKFKEQSDE